MSQFITKCQKTVLNKKDVGTTPPVIKSTYQTDYTNPKIKIRDELKVCPIIIIYIQLKKLKNKKINAFKTLVDAALPPDYLDVDSGKRILPVTFHDVFRNCISASIGERLELKFTDDTPDWKYSGRDAASKHWLDDSSSRNLKKNYTLRKNGGNRMSSLSDDTEKVLTDHTYTVSDEPFLCNYYYECDFIE